MSDSDRVTILADRVVDMIGDDVHELVGSQLPENVSEAQYARHETMIWAAVGNRIATRARQLIAEREAERTGPAEPTPPASTDDLAEAIEQFGDALVAKLREVLRSL